MTKQKITIEANIWCDKCRTKAMKVAAVEDGVKSVAFKGPRRDQLEIVGDDVDAVRLAIFLRKKLCYADLVSVEEITDKKTDKELEKEPVKVKSPCSPIWERRGCHRRHEMELHVYDEPSSGGCTIM